jgi:hypothetical protein
MIAVLVITAALMVVLLWADRRASTRQNCAA